jgi:hypothetical protein
VGWSHDSQKIHRVAKKRKWEGQMHEKIVYAKAMSLQGKLHDRMRVRASLRPNGLNGRARHKLAGGREFRQGLTQCSLLRTIEARAGQSNIEVIHCVDESQLSSVCERTVAGLWCLSLPGKVWAG